MNVLKQAWFILLIAMVVGGSTGLLLYRGYAGEFPKGVDLVYFSLVPGLLTIPVGLILVRLSELLNKKISWQSNTSLRFITEFMTVFLIMSAVGTTLLTIVVHFYTGTPVSEVYPIFKETYIRLWILLAVLSLTYSVLSMLTYSFYHYNEGQLKEVRIDRRQLKLQFEALRNQLSPHYLFNSLNTISSLIHRNPDKAESYIRRLAGTYSYVLKSKDRRLVNLSDELEFVKSYYYLLRVRYEEGLVMNIDIPEELNSLKIPPLTLQILVENAVKHNAFSEKHPLAIHLGVINQSHLSISNNKTERPAEVISSKIGLKNIKQRYAFFTSQKIEIEDKEDYRVTIPLIVDKAS